jgi:CRISPR type III-associated protein (TIGR04423 family)
MKIDNKKEVIDYINKLQNYQGYVQFSDIKIRECDIFKEFQDIKLTPTIGFIFEAHFYSKTDNKSISIKQINDSWLVSITDITDLNDTQEYLTDIQDFNYKVKMAQIWEEIEDQLCENMSVKKLKKVVFIGFTNG